MLFPLGRRAEEEDGRFEDESSESEEPQLESVGGFALCSAVCADVPRCRDVRERDSCSY